MKQLESHVRHEDPEIMSISHIHVLLLSCAISLIVSLTFTVVVSRPGLKLPVLFRRNRRGSNVVVSDSVKRENARVEKKFQLILIVIKIISNHRRGQKKCVKLRRPHPRQFNSPLSFWWDEIAPKFLKFYD